MRRFKQQLAGRESIKTQKIPLKRWPVIASPLTSGTYEADTITMTISHCQLRLTSITHGSLSSHPSILLGGLHQPTLLRYLEGWPRRWPASRSFQIRFAQQPQELSQFAKDMFDFAVIEAPSREQVAAVVHELTRIARQGVITRRQG
ncbi:hypothetical protein SAMN05216409_110125 [Pseudomonas lutea]|uniref:Uncharacterized protein n=2 Tax=Pseudomonas TaxID=286 RepID=A0A9X8MEU1_9PSED|nr:hypothetical protein SAMN05216409_110125 [Pseudomonas lutea]